MIAFPKFSRRKEILLDFCLVFLYTAMLIRPYFKAEYEDKWQSIESTFISDARFLAEHWPHPQWQPLWYTGTRFDYIYPPALRYGTAAVAKVTGFIPAKAYHFYVSFFYALGMAGIYLLIRVGTNSRAAAWLGAVSTSLMSPIFLFMPRYRGDAWKLQPQRLGVLVKYGEGPHMSALALIPIALAFTWLALEKRRPWAKQAWDACGVVAGEAFTAPTPTAAAAISLSRQRPEIAPAIVAPAVSAEPIKLADGAVIWCDAAENTVKRVVNSYGKKIKFDNGGHRIGLKSGALEERHYNTQCPDQFAGEAFAVLKAVELAVKHGLKIATIRNDRIGGFEASTKRAYKGATYLWVAKKLANENGLAVTFDLCSGDENEADRVSRTE